MVILHGKAGLAQGFGIARIAAVPLDIIAFKQPGNTAVPAAQQQLGGKAPARAVIRHHVDRFFEIRVKAVDKHHGDAQCRKAVVQINIGVGQRGFGALDNQPVHRLLQQFGQNAPLIVHPVVGGTQQWGVAVFRQHVVDAVQNGGEDIFADVGGDNRDIVRRFSPWGGAAHIGAAALHAGGQALVFQQGHGLPHGLAAVPGGTGQLVFAGQPLPAGVNAILNFGAQPVGQLCIFVFAQKIPPSRNCCVAIVFLIVSYNLCFAMPLTKK